MQNPKLKFKIQNFCKFFLLFTVYSLLFTSEALAASFQLEPASGEFQKDSSINVTVKINLGSDQSNGADAVLQYDANKLQFESLSGGAYEKFSYQQTLGKLTVNAYSLTPANYILGNQTLATVKFKAIAEGNEAFVQFVCTAGLTTDSNIWKKNGGDIIDCGNLNRASFNIVKKEEGQPGDGGQGGQGEGSKSAGCTAQQPSRPANLKAVTGPGVGQATLSWAAVSGVSHYSITYGLFSKTYLYGAPNVGNVNRFVVSLLKPGVNYYFVVAAVNNCASSGYSNEAWVVAGRKTYQPKKPTSPEKPVLPKETPIAVVDQQATPSATATSLPTPAVSPRPEFVEAYKPPKKGLPLREILLTGWPKWLALVLTLLAVVFSIKKLLNRKGSLSSKLSKSKETPKESTETLQQPPVETPWEPRG